MIVNEELLAQLRDLLPGVPVARIQSIVDVVARTLERQAAARPKNGRSNGAQLELRPPTGKGGSEMNGHSSQHSVSDLRSESESESESGSGSSQQSDPGISKLDGPTGLEFPVAGAGGKLWPLMKARVAEWAAAFPGVDVMTESRKALAWLNANPRQIKTWDGMPRFLFAWMSRAQNRGGSSPFAAPPPVATPGLCGFHQVAANANRPARAFAESCSECRHVRARMNPRPPSDPQRVGEGP